jgi:hypothetical protein
MDADEVVIHREQRVVLTFCENALVSRAKRRVCILMFRFSRSAYDGLMCFGSGLPVTRPLRAPMHGGGL